VAEAPKASRTDVVRVGGDCDCAASRARNASASSLLHTTSSDPSLEWVTLSLMSEGKKALRHVRVPVVGSVREHTHVLHRS